jgi:hypothetical protein
VTYSTTSLTERRHCLLALDRVYHTERRCRVVNTPVLYYRNSAFKPRPGHRLSCLSIFILLLTHARRIPVQYLKIRHDRLLAIPSQFITHLLPFHLTLYNLNYWKRVIINYKYIKSTSITLYSRQSCHVLIRNNSIRQFISHCGQLLKTQLLVLLRLVQK